MWPSKWAPPAMREPSCCRRWALVAGCIRASTSSRYWARAAILHFRRRTLSARLLWSPLPDGWEMQGLPAASKRPLALPHRLLQHRALLEDAQGRPFSALVETYTEQVLAFPPPTVRP